MKEQLKEGAGLVSEFLLDLLLPEGVVCLTCERLSRGELLCPDCARSLQNGVLPEPRCPRCGYPLDEKGECAFCREHTLKALSARSAWTHEGAARKLVHAFKYNACGAAGDLLAEGIAPLCAELPEDAALTWVTPPERRKKEGRIDHGRLLAEKVAALTGREALRLLERTDETDLKHQQGLNAAERAENIRGRFRARSGAEGRSVALIDDVLTTGATANECTQALLDAGAAEVRVLTATRAVRMEDIYII